MPFDTTYRYFAFPDTQLTQAALIRQSNGVKADTAPGAINGKGRKVTTLLCGLDNRETGNLRALQLGVDAVPIKLSDGRLLLAGYWTESVIQEFEIGNIEGEELTEEQVKQLQHQPEL